VTVEVISYKDGGFGTVLDRAELVLGHPFPLGFDWPGWLVIVAPGTRAPDGDDGDTLPSRYDPDLLFLEGEVGGYICIRTLASRDRPACAAAQGDDIAPKIVAVREFAGPGGVSNG
jgi:hypothetical protein